MTRRKKQIETAHAFGVHTAGDIIGLDDTTLAYAGASIGNLADQIDNARAALGPAGAYRKRGVTDPRIPRADVEVDVDIEYTNVGVYLWGTWTSPAGNQPAYRAFDDWSEPTFERGTSLFLEFWEWLMATREDARSNGLTFAAYYFTDAETGWMRNYADAAGVFDEVESFVRSDEWIDVKKEFDARLLTGQAYAGLKVLAPLAGFAWEVDDPGGAESMVKYEQALYAESESDRQEAIAWLLRYNEGDVRATLAIRDWLDREGDQIPSIETLESR